MTIAMFWLGFGSGWSYAAYLCTYKSNYRTAALGFGIAAVVVLML